MRKLLFALFACSCALCGAPSIPFRLGPEEAVRIALANRSELEAARARIQGRAGAVVQAGLRPNPNLLIQTENWRAWGDPGFQPADNLDLFVFASQRLETGRKRARRVATAEAARRVADDERLIVARLIRLETLTAYRRVQAAVRRRDLLAAGRQALDDLVLYHRRRFELGAIAELDLIKVETERERYLVPLARAAALIDRGKLELLRAMGEPAAATAFELEPADAVRREPFSAERAAEAAVSRRPEAAAAQAAVVRAQADLELQRARSKPDPTPYFGYKRTNGFNTLVGGVTIPLPIHDRNQGQITQAAAAVAEAEADLRAIQAIVRAEARTAAAAYARAREAVDLIERGVRFKAAAALEITAAAYREEGAELLVLLDAQRTKNEVELLYADALSELERARLDLEAAVGWDEAVLAAQ